MTIPSWHAADGERLYEVPDVVAAGIPTFKMYQAYNGVMLDDPSLLRALTAVADAGGRTVLHSETGPVLDMLRANALAEGHIEPIWHTYTRPAPLEATAVHRAVELADLAGCPLFIFHVGCLESIEAIAAAQARGLDVWGETCPQYLLLNAEEHLGGPDGARYICAPPLRGLEDQDALWQALANDTLQVVSTDHCPWTLAEKTRPDFTQVPGGVPSIEARLALVHHFGVNTGLLTLERWVQVCSTNPARWMGLERKGRLPPAAMPTLSSLTPRWRRLSRRRPCTRPPAGPRTTGCRSSAGRAPCSCAARSSSKINAMSARRGTAASSSAACFSRTLPGSLVYAGMSSVFLISLLLVLASFAAYAPPALRHSLRHSLQPAPHAITIIPSPRPGLT